jgi:hypothetical protein
LQNASCTPLLRTLHLPTNARQVIATLAAPAIASQKEPNSSERPASPASSENEGHVGLVFHVSFCVDVTFVVIYAAYGLVRAVELLLTDDAYYALPVLCTAAPLLLTRIAFTLMPDNIVFIALHAMMRDFTRLTFIAIWCFAGFVMGCCSSRGRAATPR